MNETADGGRNPGHGPHRGHDRVLEMASACEIRGEAMVSGACCYCKRKMEYNLQKPKGGQRM